MSRVTMEQVHTRDQPGPGDENHIVVKFQALMVNLPKDIEGDAFDMKTDDKFYIAAGATYGGDDFVWVGHVPVTLDHDANNVTTILS